VSDPTSKALRIERSDGIVTVTLDRPERKNALNRALLEELLAAFADIARRTTDRVVVVNGGSSFCSGADLSDQTTDRHLLEPMRLTGDVCVALARLPQPTIAKVRGAAVGAGFSLAIACDLVVAADQARFATMYSSRALSVDFGASWLLPRLVGLQRAKELVYFPDMFSAGEAQQLGLVNRVLPDAELDDFVGGWARRLSGAPTIALSLSKRLIDEGANRDLAAAVEAEAQAQVVNFGTQDAREAAMAFQERRDPRFTGR
jgi:2-(1,2-epoxy-1,2-dihydrophenyl)acetyl-CoA isomerase